MKPVFFKSATIDTPEWLILRGGSLRKRKLSVRYGVFVHPNAGPILIDTGYTHHALSAPGRSSLLRIYSALLKPKLIEAEQPEAALTEMGLTLSDIRAVIVTHFHADHVSGLALFPKAQIIASGSALRRIKRASTPKKIRHGVFSELLPEDIEERLRAVEDCSVGSVVPFTQAWDIFGDSSVMAVELPGHADGQIGLAFPDLSSPMLYAADVQWLLDALVAGKRPGAPSLWIAQEPKQIERSTDLVEAFRDAGGDVVLCHDDNLTPYDFLRAEP